MLFNEKTVDQIRRETVPFRHTGLIYGILGGLSVAALTFLIWALLNISQIKHYPEFFATGLRSEAARITGSAKSCTGCPMSSDELRYNLLRYGNLDHRYDGQIIRHGWFPSGASGTRWVPQHGAIPPLYSDSPLGIFKYPLAISLVSILVLGVWGLSSDYRYRDRVVAGIRLDGTIVGTIDEYNKEIKGKGMRYGVYEWKDR